MNRNDPFMVLVPSFRECGGVGIGFVGEDGVWIVEECNRFFPRHALTDLFPGCRFFSKDSLIVALTNLPSSG